MSNIVLVTYIYYIMKLVDLIDTVKNFKFLNVLESEFTFLYVSGIFRLAQEE